MLTSHTQHAQNEKEKKKSTDTHTYTHTTEICKNTTQESEYTEWAWGISNFCFAPQ